MVTLVARVTSQGRAPNIVLSCCIGVGGPSRRVGHLSATIHDSCLHSSHFQQNTNFPAIKSPIIVSTFLLLVCAMSYRTQWTRQGKYSLHFSCYALNLLSTVCFSAAGSHRVEESWYKCAALALHVMLSLTCIRICINTCM